MGSSLTVPVLRRSALGANESGTERVGLPALRHLPADRDIPGDGEAGRARLAHGRAPDDVLDP
eukprot:29216-Pelagococcus_subviridis.AAC.3